MKNAGNRSKLPRNISFNLDDSMEEFRCVLAVISHGDRQNTKPEDIGLGKGAVFFSTNEIKYFWDAFILEICYLLIRINDCWGDLIYVLAGTQWPMISLFKLDQNIFWIL